MKKFSFYVLALAAQGKGISGGDRIFIELSRILSKKHQVTLFVEEEGHEMCRRQSLASSIKYKVVSIKHVKRYGFVASYLARIVEGIKMGLTLKLENRRQTIIYSASEFWMDSLPCIFLKWRYPDIQWVAAWYQTAPNPLKGFAEGSREGKYRISAFLYWLAQLPIKPIIAWFADFVLVNNEGEREQFPRLTKQKRTLVMLGAVKLDEISDWKEKHKHQEKKYDAVFQGRFHPQKGVVELVEIWKQVVNKKPNAKLIMIGGGPLMDDVKTKIKDLGMEKNITLTGYLFDGEEKYTIFSQSKIVVHPAFYDSGGMAAAEAMSFGLPCVGFELKAYESYYPKGMIKVKTGNLAAYAAALLDILKNKKKQERIGNEAEAMIVANWSWKNRAALLENTVQKIKSA